MQAFQCDALNDMDGVNHIAQGLGHLLAMGISHHGMKVHLQQQEDDHTRILACIKLVLACAETAYCTLYEMLLSLVS